MKQAWIERPEGGGRLGFISITKVALFCGRRVTRWLMYPISIYFFFRRGPERRASRAFLTLVLNRRVTWWNIVRHIHCFAVVLLDRIYLMAENFKRFNVTSHGLDHLHAAMNLNRGVLLFGSHIGSFDALRVLSLQRSDVMFRVVIDTEQTPTLLRVLNALNPDLAATIINARQYGANTAFQIKDALDARAVVTMLADRARTGHAVVAADFLGSPAPFPAAPWLLAASLKVPVVLCFGLYRGGNRYDLYFEPFADTLEIPRQERQATLRTIVQRYADRLAYYVRLEPYNWFNFYDFWQSQTTAHNLDTAVAGSMDDAGGTRSQRVD